MIHFDPPVSIKPLDDVEPGALVRWGEQGQHLGFCVISSGDPRRLKALAVYDPEAHRFTWQPGDVPNVVSYGSDVIVQPDVESFSPALVAQPDGTLYTLEGAPHLIVAVGNAIRFLNLSTGEINARQSWPQMGGYRSWIMAVRGLDNRLVELLSVTPRYGADFDDDGPTEPEEV